MHKYKYLLWDIDGTILDFKASEAAAIKTLFNEFHLGPCTDDMIADYSSINDEYWKKLERGEMTKPEILVERFRDFFTKINIDITLAEEFNSKYQIALGDTVVFCDESDKLLLSEKNDFVLIAITNGTAVAQNKKLKKSGLDQIFDYIFISEIVGFEKPRPEFFKHVIKEAQISDTSKMLIIGDSLTSDIQGGINIGIDTCWYNPSNKKNCTTLSPTYTITNLKELANIL